MSGILLKLALLGREPRTYQRLAAELSISPSEVHAGVKRAVAARLMSDPNTALLLSMAEALGDLCEQVVFVGGCAT